MTGGLQGGPHFGRVLATALGHLRPAAPAAGEVEAARPGAFDPGDLARFRDTRSILKAALSVTPEDLAGAEEDVRQGRFRPLAEVRDELRRGTHAQG